MLTGAQAQVVMNGLVGFYPFNGNSNDYSGNDNHGTNKGAVDASDRFGNPKAAYYFDGAGAFIEVPSDSSIETDSFVSVSIWVKVEDYTVRQTPLCKRLFHNANPYNSYVITSTDVGASQKWAFGVSSGTAGSGAGPSAQNPIDTGWTHIVGTYDGASIKLFLNGTLVNSQAKTGLLGYTDSTLRIGLGIPGSSLQYFKGWIDDVRIYGRVLSNSEISTLYSNTTDLLQNPNAVTTQTPFCYPNPASDIVHLMDDDVMHAFLIGMNGQKIQLKLEGNSFSSSHIANGVYILNIETSEGILRREKLVLNH